MPATSPITLYGLSTPETVLLKLIFQASLKDDWRIILQDLPSFARDGGDFKSDGWFKAVEHKVKLGYNAIQENQGRLIIISDIDICFYRPCTSILLSAIEDNDVAFQSEFWPSTGEVNTGFRIIRCNKQTLRFWGILASFTFGDDITEQSVTNELLRSGEAAIRWSVLPNSIYAASQGSPPSDMALHHANCTVGPDSIQQKLSQFVEVRDMLRCRAVREKGEVI